MLEEKRQAALENGTKSPRSSGKKASMSQGARRASNATKSNVQPESERSTNTETGKSVSVGEGGPAVTTGPDSQFAAPMLAIGQRDGEMQANSNDSALQHTFEHNVNPLTNPSPMQFSESILAQPNLARPDEDDPTQSGSNKRIRLSDASMDLANAQDFNSFQLPTPTTFFSEAPNDQLSLMDFGLTAEQLGSDFCLPLASQQQADMPLAAFSAEHNFGLSSGFDDFAFLHPSPEGTSSSCSDSTDGRFDRALLPKILRERSNNPPRVEISDAAYESLQEDAIRRAGRDDITLPLRSRRDLEHLMTGYFDCFHRHVPIIHPPSFKVEATPSPLVLAMCAIGAQYRLDRSKARKLFDVSNQLLRAGDLDLTSDIPRLSETRSTQTSKLRPLWVMQARTLLVLLGALSNDTNLLDAELERIGGFIKDYKRRRTELAKYRDRAKQSISYKEWIEIEATKRYLCASFVCSSLLVVVYDLPPGFSITHDLDFDALDEEKLWNAPTEEAWQALRVSTSNASLTIRRVMDDMLSGSLTANDQAPYYVSGFTALVIIHAIGMYSRNLSQFTQFKTAVFSDPTENVQNMLFTAALSSFARCREILNIARPDCSDFVWNEPEGPLLSNCEAMLRVAYTRLFLYEMMPDSLMLFSNSPEENTGLLRKLVSTKQRRGPLITKAMSSMCEGFSVPAKAGYLLVQKTASISWSVEHAIAGWGCGEFVPFLIIISVLTMSI